jgi:hypothetical protein
MSDEGLSASADPSIIELVADHYVALSRSRGRKTIRLLRDFDEKLFTVHPNEHLRREDARLEKLEDETKRRYDAGEFHTFTSV